MSAVEPGCVQSGRHQHRYVRGEVAVVEVQVSGVVIVSEELLDQLLRDAGWEPEEVTHA